MSDLESIQFHLETEPFAGSVGVIDLRAVEALDQPYRIELDVVVKEADADVTTLLGTDAVLHIERSPLDRRFAGLVHEVHEGVGTEQGGFPRARLVIAPALWLLRLRRNSRIFQDQTVPEILDAVLGESLAPYGREARQELNESYTPREHCVQYQESDLAFVQRLMEEEGIHYAFEHDGDKEVLVLRDQSTSAARIETVPAGGSLELRSGGAVVRNAEPIVRFFRHHRATTTSIVIRDHEWTRAPLFVEAEQRGQDARGVDREVYEHGIDRKLGIAEYDAGPRRYQSEDGARQAAIRLEALTKDAVSVRGSSVVTGLVPGKSFELTGHPDAGFDGEYLVTRVIHESRPAEGDGPDHDRYHNRFECIPLAVPYRPSRITPRPVIEGIQTAVVTGPAGEEIHVDEHGRIKVRFHWDRESPADETSSCWVRVKQEWAGAGWGFWWVPRIGMEVVVHFIDGDPDRPLVTGAVYDGENPVPYALPDEKTKSTIKSNSSLGGGGFNELRFEDKAGSEEIFTHAQKDYNEVVENDHTTLVHGDQKNEVDGNQTQTIHANQTERVDGTQTMTVGGDRTVHVEGNFDETVDGTETRHTVGDVSETFGATETRSVGSSLDETIGGNETRAISGSHTETVLADRSRTVGGSVTDTVSGSLTETAVGGFASVTPGAHTVTATGGWTVTAPAGIVINAAAGAHLTQAGGMTRIDYEWRTQADEDKTNSFISIEFYITKSELVGFHYAAGTLRVAMGESNEKMASKSDAAAARAKAIGAYIKKSGLYNRLRQTIKA